MTNDLILKDFFQEDYDQFSIEKKRKENIYQHIKEAVLDEEIRYIAYIVDKCLDEENDSIIIEICLRCINRNEQIDKNFINKIIYTVLQEESYE